MKAILILLTLTLVLRADDLGSIDFTKSDGTTVSATVIKVLPDGLLLRYAGGGGKVDFRSLDAATQRRFGYDPEAAAKKRTQDAKEKEAYELQIAQARAAAAKNAAANAAVAAIASTRMIIIGKVSQVTKAGLMVQAEFQQPITTTSTVSPSGRGVSPYQVTTIRPPTDGIPLFVGRCLVTGGEAKGWTDGTRVTASVYPNGTHTYESVGAGTVTIQQFTLSPAMVTEPADVETFNRLKGSYRFNR